jgi:hypothetical protein
MHIFEQRMIIQAGLKDRAVTLGYGFLRWTCGHRLTNIGRWHTARQQ